MSRVKSWLSLSPHMNGRCSIRAMSLMIVLSIMATGFLAGFEGRVAMAAAPDLTGLWIDHTKRGAVEIQRCSGKKTALCGRVYWMIKEHDKNGNPYRDKLNKRKSRRKRALCGMKVLGNVKRMSKRIYDGGWIYDHDQGKSFDVELRLKSMNILQVKGYLGTKLLSKTFYWRRARKELKHCSPKPLG